MTKGLKILTTILIILVGVLAIGTGFFYAKTVNLEKQLKGELVATDDSNDASLDQPLDTNSVVTPTPSSTVTTTPTATPTVTATTTPTPTPTASLKSGATGTYTVKSGDTMSSIATGLGISWLTLAKENSMDEAAANNIKVGQVLKVPAK